MRQVSMDDIHRWVGQEVLEKKALAEENQRLQAEIKALREQSDENSPIENSTPEN